MVGSSSTTAMGTVPKKTAAPEAALDLPRKKVVERIAKLRR